MFNVETSILDRISTMLKSISEDLLVQSNVMESIIQDMASSWNSNDSYKYIQENEDVKNKIENVAYNILNLSNDVKTVSRQVRQAEDTLENKFNNF